MKYLLAVTLFIYLETTHANSSTSDIARGIWSTIKESTKEPKCTPFYVLNKLNLTDKDGNLQTKNIPYFNLYNNATLVQCMETNKKKEKCDKINSVARCFVDTETKKYIDDVKACSKESKFEMRHFHLGDFIALYSDDKYKCFVRCMWIKQGAIGDDNNFTNGLIGNSLHTFGPFVPGVDAAMKKCGAKKDGNKCNEAFERGSCFIEEMIFANI